MATNLNACPTCKEIRVYYGVSFAGYDIIQSNNIISLTDDICNRLSIGMPVHICNRGEILMLYPMYETMSIGGQCAYIIIGAIGSSNWGIAFGTCFFSNNNKTLSEFTSSNVIDIY